MHLVRKFSSKPKRHGKKIKGVVNGKEKHLITYKNTPKKCSAPRRICIVCLVEKIDKRSSNYESKICKSCTPNL